MEEKRIATAEERMAAFIAATDPCNDCGEREPKGSKHCSRCTSEDQELKDRGLFQGIPAVLCLPEEFVLSEALRPSIPEDFRDPSPHPPYARCAEVNMDPGLPENAGRHPAPESFDSTTDTIKYLAQLRAANGLRRC
jgi:hypothetical protein